MRGARTQVVIRGVLPAMIFFGCGYSQEELDQHIRTADALRSELGDERKARLKAEADYADALEELERMRAEALDRQERLSTVSADLRTQQKALEEYSARLAELERVRARFEALRGKLMELTKLGLTVEVRGNRMVILLPGDVLFDSGKDTLKAAGISVILSVGEVIRNDADLREREFQVAGHTDDRPFQGGLFQDNWGLSVMRARSVVELLVRSGEDGGVGLAAARFSAAGYGSTDPVADNATDEGRALNRRVELVLLPDLKEMLDLTSIDDRSDGGS
jgi:chemotaxis protein MotB